MIMTFLFNHTTTLKRLKDFKYFNCNLIILWLSVTHPVTFKNYNAAKYYDIHNVNEYKYLFKNVIIYLTTKLISKYFFDYQI